LNLLFVAAAAAADYLISATIADFEPEICGGSMAILPECRKCPPNPRRDLAINESAVNGTDTG
jgi:hypothetical protein